MRLLLIFVGVLSLNLFFWLETHLITKNWFDTPPAPEKEKSAIFSFGDKELAHRSNSIMLQNLGNKNGDVQSLKSYDYKRLKDWFFVQDHLNQRSDVTPMMAAYYFGSVRDKDKLNNVLDYLAMVGSRPEGEKWRWLGHAVYLAKHDMGDVDRALELAYLLSNNSSPDLADWARQMPAFILESKGDNKLAYEVMLAILQSEGGTLHPNEVNFMIDYMCNRLLVGDLSQSKPEFCN